MLFNITHAIARIRNKAKLCKAEQLLALGWEEVRPGVWKNPRTGRKWSLELAIDIEEVAMQVKAPGELAKRARAMNRKKSK